ncbi:hypothetical protein AMATHDRAFT_138273 [Amanita thiersii Skay4041]|uniref:Probable acetate kinase n=1 Tax=Amanita thiersii Skay4041 TaxID=703135 RepID=A0A2A9NSX0_9AGAR|nr:hypothetical protein AMATHDRAFT_138273 [Amanita thiersii Skay4041]
MTLILAINAGSSSLKLSLYHRRPSLPSLHLILNASISNIQSSDSQFNLSIDSRHFTDSIEAKDHSSAFAYFIGTIDKHPSIDKISIRYACHRIVHGGTYTNPVRIDSQSYAHIEHLSDLAPLHNGAALSVIQACHVHLPNAVPMAFFDSTFHQTIPPHIYSYAINQDIAVERGLRKYGFHGLSYAYILRAISEYLNKPRETLNLIILHLGSGASACAVRRGVSLDTSMGLTPLAGLPGATRSGSVDPSLIFHYTNKAGRITHDPSLVGDIGVTEAEDILNRKSGWKAISGSSNFKDIVENATHQGPPENLGENLHNLAFHLFLDRILNYIGAYHLKLGARVDALVFAGGIGEQSPGLRQAIGDAVQCLQYQRIDSQRNRTVTFESSSVSDIGEGQADEGRILVCKTDEQFEMAQECALDENLW